MAPDSTSEDALSYSLVAASRAALAFNAWSPSAMFLEDIQANEVPEVILAPGTRAVLTVREDCEDGWMAWPDGWMACPECSLACADGWLIDPDAWLAGMAADLEVRPLENATMPEVVATTVISSPCAGRISPLTLTTWLNGPALTVSVRSPAVSACTAENSIIPGAWDCPWAVDSAWSCPVAPA